MLRNKKEKPSFEKIRAAEQSEELRIIFR